MPTIAIVFLEHYTAFFFAMTVLLAVTLSPFFEEKEARSSYEKYHTHRTDEFPLLTFFMTGTSSIGLLTATVLSDVFAETYYDYFISQTALINTGFIWMFAMALATAFASLRQRAKLLLSIMLMSGTLGLIFPLQSYMQQQIGALIFDPVTAHGTIQAKDITSSRAGATWTVTIDGNPYRVQPQWYAELKKGDAITFVHDPANRVAFPQNAVHFTNNGKNILLWLIPIWACTCLVVLIGLKYWLSIFWRMS